MVISQALPLLLGSGSPRRREILEIMRIPLRIQAGNAEEDLRSGESPASYLSRVVREKLRDVAYRIDGPVGGILVADTIVLLDSEILGKPKDEGDACRMLTDLSGRQHEVRTRFALATSEAPSVPIHEQSVSTRVHFRVLSKEEIGAYAASGEGLDKAGAYAAQGLGAFAVERIDGSYPNVVGLPICEVISALLRTGLMRSFPCA